MTHTPHFDRIARPYRWLEYLTLGPILQRTRTHFLPQLTHCRQALILGDGDGRFTAALLTQNLAVQAQAVDLSPAMLNLLRRNVTRVAAESRLLTHQADIRTFTPEMPPDLITTHFVLDCLTQPEVDALIGRLAPILQPHGLWLFSDFRIPSGPLHWPARLHVRLLYLAFRILTGLRVTQLPNHAATLARHGLRRIAQRTRLFGILTTELWRVEPSARNPL